LVAIIQPIISLSIENPEINKEEKATGFQICHRITGLSFWNAI
jgi:hypothetical protein